MRRCGLSRLIYLVEGNTAHATLGRGKSIPFAMIASQVSRSGVGCAAAVVGLTHPAGSLCVCVRVCACVRACVRTLARSPDFFGHVCAAHDIGGWHH